MKSVYYGYPRVLAVWETHDLICQGNETLEDKKENLSTNNATVQQLSC